MSRCPICRAHIIGLIELTTDTVAPTDTAAPDNGPGAAPQQQLAQSWFDGTPVEWPREFLDAAQPYPRPTAQSGEHQAAQQPYQERASLLSEDGELELHDASMMSAHDAALQQWEEEEEFERAIAESLSCVETPDGFRYSTRTEPNQISFTQRGSVT